MIFMKNIFLILLAPFAFFFSGISGNPLVFDSDGDVALVRAGIVVTNFRGYAMEIGDTIIINRGTVSFVDKDYRRISLETPGKYCYNSVKGMMDKTNASIANKYMYMVWQRMNTKETTSSLPGGVIRASGYEFFPMDSAIMLGFRIDFSFKNPYRQEFRLIIKDEKFKIIDEYVMDDSIKIVVSDSVSWWRPGIYRWEVERPYINPLGSFVFIIPTEEESGRIQSEISTYKQLFNGFTEEVHSLLMDEYYKQNKWIEFRP
jgi:hypothetical protein